MEFGELIEHKMYAYLVGKQMFCPMTGKVLDIRTAVVLEHPEGRRTLAIVSPEAWAEKEAAVRETLPDVVVVIDGKVQ